MACKEFDCKITGGFRFESLRPNDLWSFARIRWGEKAMVTFGGCPELKALPSGILRNNFRIARPSKKLPLPNETDSGFLLLQAFRKYQQDIWSFRCGRLG